jgi:sigma-B regulation protein RsbU (phosphoserine phosphatase)
VPEAERSDRKQFGLERTVTMLRRFEDLPPQSIVTGMSSAVYDFVGEVPQFDDLTMLVLHYKGRPSDGQS